ncbi:MAG: hypothetical protein OEZ57_06505 [Nitrospirota bacterium]|nr:hypothetical protein [Nitrospirota bacterium]MDH5774550.1 hypothetical protein [Nitrospirota bacterium]
MPLFLLFTILLCSPTFAHAGHGQFDEIYQDDRLLPDEEYIYQEAEAATYEEVGDYYPEFARRVLARFVLRAEQLGFAKELDQRLLPIKKV